MSEQEECLILGAGDSEIQLAGARLRAGHLVSFPTETVYGLGADALNNTAASNIYAVKGRPPTDPLIVHVTDIEQGMSQLWNVSDNILKIARLLFSKFAPGPLTLVAKANEDKVAPVVHGGSGMVGLRVPAHPVARALIDASKCPIAAPSANTFGHVSPTIAEHVYFDLASRDPQLTILDGGRCSVGVESTVARITSEDEIEILRRGAVSHEMMLEALSSSSVGEEGDNNSKELFSKIKIIVKDTRKKAVGNIATPMAGPGQLLTHYSPAVPAYLIDFSKSCFVVSSENEKKSSSPSLNLHLRYVPPTVSKSTTPSLTPGVSTNNLQQQQQQQDAANAAAAHMVVGGVDARSFPLSETILIDYGNILATQLNEQFGHLGFDLRKHVLAYKSLSPNCRSDEASREVFAMLRWTEDIAGAQAVALPLVMGVFENGFKLLNNNNNKKPLTSLDKTLLEAVEDRLFRAASGRTAQFVDVIEE